LDLALLEMEGVLDLGGKRPPHGYAYAGAQDGNPLHQAATAILVRNIPEGVAAKPWPWYGNTHLVADYNNTHTQEVVEEWFEKAAADESID
jgi:hypothetical protein